MDYEEIKETIVYSAVAWLVFNSMDLLFFTIGFVTGNFALGLVDECACNT